MKFGAALQLYAVTASAGAPECITKKVRAFWGRALFV
jgi:hypothetical protein